MSLMNFHSILRWTIYYTAELKQLELKWSKTEP